MTAEHPPGENQQANADIPALLWLRTLPGEPQQVGEARRWIMAMLPDCDAREILVQIASEFCANAVEHTRSGDPGGQFTVHLAWSLATARLVVGDEGSAEHPGVVEATLANERGRGLAMVGLMADRWGFTGDKDGRLLWADTSWSANGGPARIDGRGALSAMEAMRRLRGAYPGIRVGYGGSPAGWRALLPGADDPIVAPCFGALIKLTAARAAC